MQQARGFLMVKWDLLPLALVASKPLAVIGSWTADKNQRDPTESEAKLQIVVCIDRDEECEVKEKVADRHLRCLPQFLLMKD